MEIDVRHKGGVVDEIRVGDSSVECDSVDLLCQSNYGVSLENDEADVMLYITSKEHALNVIKGINKAIELGWLK